MKNNNTPGGFTLIELVIVTAIVAVLAGVAYPSYQQAVRDSRRAEIITVLQRIALRQASWRARQTTYASSIAELCDCANDDAFDNSDYTVSIVDAGAAGFRLQDDAKTGSAQIADREGDTACARLSLSVGANNLKTPAACWP